MVLKDGSGYRSFLLTKFAAVDEEPLLDRLELLLTWFSSWLAENQLSLQAPVKRDVPGAGNLLVD